MSRRCPKCDSRVFCIDSRPVEGQTRRRYYCPKDKCGHRFSTIEVPLDDGESVKKFLSRDPS